MTAATDEAVELAAGFREEGTVVVSRPVLYRRAREETEAEGIDHEAVREAMSEAGWEYGRHLYFDAEALGDRIAELAASYREAGRLLLTHREVCDRLAGSEDRTKVEGWTKGPFVEAATAAFADAGWPTDTIDDADSRVYVYPLLEAIRDEHPRGRFWRSPEELFGYYLQASVGAAIEAE